eukprot:TRINITY_DN7342_c0_g5_i1.p1 TRINITY_DN7342_c0_g5~~TRINITY_DN7342_c0_g5_i1.p1  ORF type:complete len:189 (+),score=55.73 TRINITY_DN7342_c0_g5_i1:59-625(+)
MVKKRRVAKLNNKAKRHVQKLRASVTGELATHYDRTLTLRQNYANLKLVSDANTWASKKTPTAETLAEPVITPMGSDNVVVDEVSLEDLEALRKNAEKDAARIALSSARKGKKSILKPGEKLKLAPPKKINDKYMSEGQMQLAEKLIKKYKDDYQAMSRDIKLNAYQDTPAKLKKLCESFTKTQSASS